MREIQFEDLLRQTLHSEADSLTLTVTVDVLEKRLAQRRGSARTGRRWLAIAAVAAVLLASLAVAIVGGLVPSLIERQPPTPAVVLPEPKALLRDFPDATLRLEHAIGPADRPVELNSSSAPGATLAPIEVGRVTFAGPFVIGIACLGEGELRIEVVTPSLGIPYTNAIAPCDGTPVISQYLAMPIDPASVGDAVIALVSPGASWRLAIGELPAALVVPPGFSPVTATPGWHLVSQASPVLLADPTPRTGALISVPARATRAALFVQCHGAGTLSVAFGDVAPTDVACDEIGAARRIEFAVSGGESLTVRATGDRAGLWVVISAEANAEITTSYPTAPLLPDGLGSVPYVAPDARVIGVGTLGSNHQVVLPIADARPGSPAGDLLPVAINSQTDGARLDLVSIGDGAVLRTLVQVPAPSLIFDSWADARHDQVFYLIALESRYEFHRVSALGGDDIVVATVLREGQAGFTADLSDDESIFVVDACQTGVGCSRTIVDAASGAVQRVDRSADPVCRILGIADGVLIGTSRSVCTEDSTTALIAAPVADGAPVVLMRDAPRAEIGDGVVVVTPDGPKVVFAASVTSDGTPSIKVIDARTGALSDLPRGTIGDPRLFPYPIRLPAGWLLLAGGALGDFPWQKGLDRPPPILVNLVSGERIELVNLPHWVGTLAR